MCRCVKTISLLLGLLVLQPTPIPMEQFWCIFGVQQGNPLGPLLFVFALHKLVINLGTELGEDLLLNVWFLMMAPPPP